MLPLLVFTNKENNSTILKKIFYASIFSKKGTNMSDITARPNSKRLHVTANFLQCVTPGWVDCENLNFWCYLITEWIQPLPPELLILQYCSFPVSFPKFFWKTYFVRHFYNTVHPVNFWKWSVNESILSKVAWS